MRDERNDLIRVGDALNAITDWLCEEELRHGIEPSRRVNKFFAEVMLEKVPRTEATADAPQTEKNCDNCGSKTEACYFCDGKCNMWTPQKERSE